MLDRVTLIVILGLGVARDRPKPHPKAPEQL